MKNIVSAMNALRNCLIEHINDYMAENNTQEVAVPVITAEMIKIAHPDYREALQDYFDRSHQLQNHELK